LPFRLLLWELFCQHKEYRVALHSAGLYWQWLAAQGVPGGTTFGWIVLAMVGARTCAMGFNRIVDRKFDEANPRTASRALPANAVKLSEAWAMVILAGGIFFFACYNLNQLTLILSPFALSLTLFYSLTKRFTWLCHVVLGVALAFSPLGLFQALCNITRMCYLPVFCSGLLALILYMPAWMPILMPRQDFFLFLLVLDAKMLLELLYYFIS
jgi:4-hydroxybenzoate polyprenyltransferase